MQQPELNDEYWSNRYLNNDAAWDIGEVSSSIKGYIDQFTNKEANILIPGCGNAYEAEYLLQQGFQHITLIDISEALTNALKEKFAGKKHIRIIKGDFFELKDQFDLIIEQTFLSALHPSLRKKYAEQMYALLKPGGTVAGVLFNKEFDSNPPFGGSAEEYKEMFSEKFEIRTLTECYNSILPREGTEVFFILKKKS